MAVIEIKGDASGLNKTVDGVIDKVKDLGKEGEKTSIVSKSDKEFFKRTLKRELKSMNTELDRGKKNLADLTKHSRDLVKGSKEELAVREKITKAVKEQAKLQNDMAQIQAATGGGSGGFLSKIPNPMKVAMAVGAFGLGKAVQGTGAYRSGVGDRVRLQGLGFSDQLETGGGDLARAGLTSHEMRSRLAKSGAQLGSATSESVILQQSRFEREKGLEGGTMSNISGGLRANFGAKSANEIQMKLQASILAAGIEDSLAPYLEAQTSLLTNINENGLTQTSDLIRVFASLTKNSGMTPEQISKTFRSMNDSVKGSSDESNAFFQEAFAEAGIGGGTIGGTQFALESSGLLGLNSDELKERGYGDELRKGMGKMGFFKGAKDRSQAMMSRFKSSAGLDQDQDISKVDTQTMIMISNMANKVFGTKGIEGFDAVKMLDKVSKGDMSQKTFDKKMGELSASPESKALKLVNATLAGQTDIAIKHNATSLDYLGQTVANTANMVTRLDTLINIGGGKLAEGASDLVNGGIGDWAFDLMGGNGGAASRRRSSERDDAAKDDKYNVKGRHGSNDIFGMNDFFDKMGAAFADALTKAPKAQVILPVDGVKK